MAAARKCLHFEIKLCWQQHGSPPFSAPVFSVFHRERKDLKASAAHAQRQERTSSLKVTSSPISFISRRNPFTRLLPPLFPANSSPAASVCWPGLLTTVLAKNSQVASHMATSSEAAEGMENAAAFAAAAAKTLLVHNEQLMECAQTSAEFLSSSARGAYTTARTVNRNSVFEFEFHVARLAQSVELMIDSSGKSDTSAISHQLTKVETLRPLVLKSLRTGLTAFSERYADYEGELKVTALLTWTDQTHDLYIHFTTLPAPPVPPVKVEIRGHPRTNAAAKDSEWVRQRKTLEDSKPPDVNEILLMDDDGSVLEGMSSNFFVVQGGAVITAQEGVLLGTVREVALAVCRQQGIEVQLKAPNAKEANLWDGAFITSTSRLVLPIDELHIPSPSGSRVYRYEQPLVHKIAQLVRDNVASNSTRVC